MLRVLPTSDPQDINIIPRDTTSIEGVDLYIAEEGTKKEEVLTNVECFIDGNFVCITISPTILREDHFYMFTFKQDGKVWYFGKAYCTSQVDADLRFSLNKNEYIHGEESSDGYTVI